MAFLPILLALVSVVIWLYISVKRHNYNYMRHELLATIVILFFLAHPSLVRLMFALFSCTEIEEGEFWLINFMDIECWGDTHTFYALVVGIPSIAIWGIGMPTATLKMLMKEKKNLD
mmetsp:Transcript_11804/g.1765  ORF Transcript_11804/g.1765 Transcript_11804/m.1765 type:complete len:117 (+) Transcript_11804:504-854(+)